MMRATRWVVLGAALVAGGCSFRKLTADSTADLLHASAPQFNTLEDLDFAEESAPANLVTMESVWRVSQENEDVLVELVQGYAAYGYAFMEDRMERAHAADDDIAEQRYRQRAQAAYRRAKGFGLRLLAARHAVDGGPEARLREGLPAWRAYLRRFDDREDVPALFWTANAWASLIGLSVDDTEALLDLPFAVALAERARDLDPDYAHGAVHAFFGVYHASTPQAAGGRPDLARAAFERALGLSNRHYLTWQVLEARTYAVMVQDRALYRRLLQEVLDAGDVMPEERLSNLVAKRRAERYLAEIDTVFPPADEPAAEAPEATTETTH
ncbi:MAG: TRAP transporter TatT component family protein [Polyangiales bacterium]